MNLCVHIHQQSTFLSYRRFLKIATSTRLDYLKPYVAPVSSLAMYKLVMLVDRRCKNAAFSVTLCLFEKRWRVPSGHSAVLYDGLKS